MPYADKFMNSTALGNDLKSRKSDRRKPGGFWSASVGQTSDLSGLIGTEQRGIIIAPDLEVSGTELKVGQSWIDEQELIRYALFWDKLVWPTSNGIHIEGGNGEKFLESEGILIRPSFAVQGDLAKAMIQTFADSFKHLNDFQPGLWALGQTPASILNTQNGFKPESGLKIEFCSAVPIPNKDVSLVDLLEFKSRRSAELLSLRAHFEELTVSLNKSENTITATQQVMRRIDTDCFDLFRVLKEGKIKSTLSDFGVCISNGSHEVEVDWAKLFGSIVLGGTTELSAPENFPNMTGILAGIGAMTVSGAISVKSKFTLAHGRSDNISKSLKPYGYVAKYHTELDWL